MTITCRTKTAAIPFIVLILLSLTSCASKPAAETEESSILPVTLQDELSPAEDLPVGEVETVPSLVTITRKTGNFYLSDASVLADIENGSPESLRSAASKLKRTDDNYSDDEVTLLQLATAIMNYAWPQEKITWVTPTRQPVNSYTEIINSVKQGVYDAPSDPETADFLSLTLPSLLLCTATTSHNWHDECLRDLSAAATLNDSSPLLLYLFGLLYQKRGDFTSALSYAAEAQAATPASYETAYLYASLLNRTGRYEESLQLAETLYEKDRYNVSCLKLCAQSAWNGRNIDKADTYVALVLQREPENEEFLLLRAGILYERNEFLNASSLLDAYAKRDTNNRDYLVLRTRLYQNWTRNNNAALATIGQALALYPDDSEVLLLATEIAMATGLSVGGRTGRQLLEQLEKVEPDNRLTLELLVNQAVLEENWDKAYQASSALIADGTVTNHLTHISICLNTNHIVEAEKLVMTLYENYPDDESVQQQYIRVLIASGRSAQALVLIEKLLPGAQGKVKSALYYEKSRLDTSKEKQLADLRSSLTANPRNQDALFSLYEYYFEKNDYRKAQYYLKQLIALNSGNTRYLALNTQLDSLVNTRN